MYFKRSRVSILMSEIPTERVEEQLIGCEALPTSKALVCHKCYVPARFFPSGLPIVRQ